MTTHHILTLAGDLPWDLQDVVLTAVEQALEHAGAQRIWVDTAARGVVAVRWNSWPVTTSPSSDAKNEIFASDFSHADESAQPGTYEVRLAKEAFHPFQN